MTIEPPYYSDDVKKTHSDKTVLTTETRQNVSEHTLTPVRKKETAKAWLLTLLLHLLIAGSLVGYWYFYHRPQPSTTIAVDLPSTKPAVVDTTPASAVSTLASVVTVASHPASTATMTAAAPSESKPLANYVAKQQLQQPAQSFNLPSNTITAVPITTIEQKVITTDAPIKKALTERDIAKNERTPTPESNSSAQAVISTKKDTAPLPEVSKAPSDTAKKSADNDNVEIKKTNNKKPKTDNGDAPEKEATTLSKDIDADTDRLSDLIEKVKNKNQQKIDAQTTSSISITSPKDKDGDKDTPNAKPASTP